MVGREKRAGVVGRWEGGGRDRGVVHGGHTYRRTDPCPPFSITRIDRYTRLTGIQDGHDPTDALVLQTVSIQSSAARLKQVTTGHWPLATYRIPLTSTQLSRLRCRSRRPRAQTHQTLRSEPQTSIQNSGT